MTIKEYKFTYADLSAWDKHEGNDGGFRLSWGCSGFGFGQLTFYIKDGKTICDSECMSPEFVKQLLAYWLESITFQ